MENIKPDKPTTVGTLLSVGTSTFSVSFFQRDYCWASVQRKKFLDDLKSLDQGQKHFFGHMIFSETDTSNELKIIDGQQRLITVTIMAAVIRDILHERRNPKSEEIHNWYVKIKDRESEEYGFRLELSDACNVFFREHVQMPGDPKEKLIRMKRDGSHRLSHRLIKDCYRDFYNFLKESPSESLIETWHKLNQDFFVIPAYMGDLGFASTYFETLNDRGMPLTLSDKMKCRLLRVADREWKHAKQSWDFMSNLEGLDGNNMNTFLRHYWLSTEGQISKKHLFDAYCEKRIQGKTEAFELLRELDREAENYSILLKPVASSFAGDKETLHLLDELHLLSKMQVMPLIMAAYPSFDTLEFRRLVKYTVNFIFRYLTICERENKYLESLFSRAAKEIRKSKDARKAKFILEEFRNSPPTEDEFSGNFAEKRIKRDKTAKYILGKIEMEMQKKERRDTIELTPKLTLEHILPKNPDEECERYMKSNGIWNTRSTLVDRLGNMTLLLGPDNEEGKNWSPMVKSNIIYAKQTSLKINEDLANINSWTLNDIDARQVRFAELARKIWTL